MEPGLHPGLMKQDVTAERSVAYGGSQVTSDQEHLLYSWLS